MTESEKKLLRDAATGIEGCPPTFAAEDIVALLHWLEVLPCEPSKLPPGLKLTIVAEDHRNQPKSVYEESFKKGASGKAFVAYEAGLEHLAGLDFSAIDKKGEKHFLANADGIMPFMLTKLGERSEGVLSGQMIEHLVSALTLDEAVASRPINDALQILKREEPALGASAELLLQKITALAKSRAIFSENESKFEPFDALAEGKGLELSPQKVTEVLRAFEERLRPRLLSEVARPDFIFRNHAPLINPKTLDTSALYQKEVKIEWRNRNMTHAVLRLACEAAEAGVQEIFLHCGAAHAPGIYQSLVRVLQRTGATKNTRVLVETVKGFKPDDSKAWEAIPQSARVTPFNP